MSLLRTLSLITLSIFILISLVSIIAFFTTPNVAHAFNSITIPTEGDASSYSTTLQQSQNTTRPQHQEGMQLPIYTLSDVAQGSSRENCLLAIHGNVYNVTSYIPYHPGGTIILDYCGKEVTGIFASIHSNYAWDLLKRYKIGVLRTPHQNLPRSPVLLNDIAARFESANPGARVIKVNPRATGYTIKVLSRGVLYEVHLSPEGKITRVEAENEEAWELWESDEENE